mmetsp:Transcript_10285/g.11815  ORF Transcript_10285/g.11815 Transcript_10285/m.11815 type:complete len:385 (+) Transcript_10285:160-1314(+)
MSSTVPPTGFLFSSTLRNEVSQEQLREVKTPHHHQQTQFQLLNNHNNLNDAVEHGEKHEHNRILEQHLSEWKPEHFPHKMYDLLEDVEHKGFDNIVSWCSDGKSFKIHNQIAFEQRIMPLYFSGMSSYKSFRRQLNLYGIYKHRHAYSREFLARGHRHLCDLIGRKKHKTTKNGGKSLNGSNNNSNNSPTKDIIVSAKNSKGNNSKDHTVNMKKRDASVARTMMDEKNQFDITTTPIATTSTTTTKRQMQSLEAELVRIQQLQLQRQQQSQLLFNRGSQLHGNTLGISTASTMNDVTKMNALMKLVRYDELLTRPNPIEYGSNRMAMNTNTNTNTNNNGGECSSNNSNDMFRSFMGQYWEDLPNDLTSTQVVDEIIATFQQQHS